MGKCIPLGKGKLYHSYVLQSSYGKKDIQHMQMKKMHRRRTMRMLDIYKEVVEGVL